MASFQTDAPVAKTNDAITPDASRSTLPIRRYGLVVGALVGVATVATILVGTVLPEVAPRPAALPPMSNSLGYYDHIQVTTKSLPAMSNSFGYYDHIQATTKAAQLPPMSNSLGFWDRIQTPTAQLPAMSNSFGYWDHIQASSTALPPMSNSLGYWDHIASLSGR